MQKKFNSFACICVALPLCLASGAQASLINPAQPSVFVSSETEAMDAQVSTLTNFWDNTPRRPQLNFDVSSLIMKTREDANLKFGVETASPNPFSFAVGAPSTYNPNFSFSISPDLGSNFILNFDRNSSAILPGLSVRP